MLYERLLHLGIPKLHMLRAAQSTISEKLLQHRLFPKLTGCAGMISSADHSDGHGCMLELC